MCIESLVAIRLAIAVELLHGNVIDTGCRWRVIAQRAHEHFECILCRTGLYVDAVSGVEHPSGNAVRHRLAVHERTHAHSLDNAGDMYAHVFHRQVLSCLFVIADSLAWRWALGCLEFQAGCGRRAGEFAMADPAQAQEPVGELVDARADSLEGENLEAVVVIEVYMHGRDDFIRVVMLDLV